MSRNADILMRTLLGVSPLGSMPENLTISPPAEPSSFGEEASSGNSNCANLPSVELHPAERREMIKLITAVFRANDPTSPRVVAITGIDDTVSSARIAACAGKLLAEQANQSVCVIDADVHNGKLHHHFGLASRVGLTESLHRDDSIRDYSMHVSGGLWVLCAGLISSGNGLATLERMRKRVAELRREFDYCLLVVPPIATCGDALMLRPMVDGVLLVVEADVTRRDAAAAAKQTLARAGMPILGAILNERKFPIPQWLYSHL